jgi:hypothetical protein
VGKGVQDLLLCICWTGRPVVTTTVTWCQPRARFLGQRHPLVHAFEPWPTQSLDCNPDRVHAPPPPWSPDLVVLRGVFSALTRIDVMLSLSHLLSLSLRHRVDTNEHLNHTFPMSTKLPPGLPPRESRANHLVKGDHASLARSLTQRRILCKHPVPCPQGGARTWLARESFPCHGHARKGGQRRGGGEQRTVQTLARTVGMFALEWRQMKTLLSPAPRVTRVTRGTSRDAVRGTIGAISTCGMG